MLTSHMLRNVMAALGIAAFLLVSIHPAQSNAAVRTFATPEAAATALADAAKKSDQSELLAILGPSLTDWIQSGDPVADQNAREKFVADYEQKQAIETTSPGKATLLIGDDAFPFPIPIVKTGDKWSFDPEKGKQEIIDRRVGENELDTIQALLAIADAQNDYVELNPLGKRAPEYARRFISSPDKHDGLYWPSADADHQSPLGELAAQAATVGYKPSSDSGEASKSPFHGYYFRMLTAQGPNAPGGAYPYVVNGRMIGGFAVIAWPAKYGASGYKTFMINQDQTVYEADLGPSTAAKVQEIQTFDPDEDWKKVDTN